jgi:hypothetical protein
VHLQYRSHPNDEHLCRHDTDPMGTSNLKSKSSRKLNIELKSIDENELRIHEDTLRPCPSQDSRHLNVHSLLDPDCHWRREN